MRPVFILVLLLFQLNLSSQVFEWADKYKDSSNSFGTSILHDSGGNSYVIADYSRPGQGGFTLIKYDDARNVIWNDRITTPYFMVGAIDKFNHILIVSCEILSVDSSGHADSAGYCLSRYDTDGNFLSRKLLINMYPVPQYKWIWSISAGQSGNYYIAGGYRDTLNFGNHQLITGDLNQDFYVAKFNQQDSCLWLKGSSSGKKGSVYGAKVKTDKNENVYVSCSYLDTLIIEDDTLKASFFDGLICKYDQNGEKQWIYNVGSAPYSDEYISGFATDEEENVYLTGTYDKQLTIGNTTFSTTSEFDVDIFMCRLNQSGIPVWARKIAGPKFDISRDICVSPYGELYLAAQYDSAIYINHHVLTSASASTVSSYEGFVAKFSSSGNFLWAINTGCDSGGASGCSAISFNNRSVYLTGSFAGAVNFGGHPLFSSDPNLFFTKINDLVAMDPEQQSAEAGIKIYPNPCSSVLNISQDKERPAHYSLFDYSGRKIFDEKLEGNARIDMSKLTVGLYLLNIQSEDSSITQKIIIE